MPVFGIVPYRTEARTRSEARIQAEVDRLLLILKTVNEVIRTAEGRLISLFIPPPLQRLFLPSYGYPKRAEDRDFRQPAPEYTPRVYGFGLEEIYPDGFLGGANWGTIQ